MSEDHTRITLRLPTELKDWLESKSKANYRTVTGELIELIRQAKEKDKKDEFFA